jgi:hypothetical protein
MIIAKSLINHVVLVVDESSSMRTHKEAVISVFDAQVASLAKLSLDMNQETRISVYLFSDQHRIRNVVADVDVLRMPSLRGSYEPNGWTALLDAVILSQEDLAQTFTKYGDHAFLTYVITDGFENRSRYGAADRFRKILAGQDNRWTLAMLVPDQAGKRQAIQYGFPEGNIAVWDVNSATGFVDAGVAMAAATETYMTSRASGVTKSTTMFAGGAEQVNAATISAAGLKPLAIGEYMLVPITWDDDSAKWRMSGKKTKAMPEGVPSMEIQTFVESLKIKQGYVVGTCYYRLEKSEKVDVTKKIIVVHRQSGQAYEGPEARQLIGLSMTATRIKPLPIRTGEYDIYVMSTSNNRLLPKHSKLLIRN